MRVGTMPDDVQAVQALSADVLVHDGAARDEEHDKRRAVLVPFDAGHAILTDTKKRLEASSRVVWAEQRWRFEYKQ